MTTGEQLLDLQRFVINLGDTVFNILQDVVDTIDDPGLKESVAAKLLAWAASETRDW